MAKWQVKDLSKMTGVSIQTLHYYDKINLLKPSLRATNCYRFYSEEDLLKLQQIIALKFFGFNLVKIKELLINQYDVISHFKAQAELLSKQANNLQQASNALNEIIDEAQNEKSNLNNTSVTWKNIIKLIRVYDMVKQLDNSWAHKVFDQQELKQYAEFESNLKNKLSQEDAMAMQAAWYNVIKQVGENIDSNPTSEIGYKIAKQTMDFVITLYGAEHANLKETIWHKGYKQGKVDGEQSLEPRFVEWLDKAIDNYYRTRIYLILSEADKQPTSDLEQQWHNILYEIGGNYEEPKKVVLESALSNNKVTDKVKEWLRKIT